MRTLCLQAISCLTRIPRILLISLSRISYPLAACRVPLSALSGSHVIFALQETRRYKVISVDNHHNSSPKALERVAQIARDALPADASEQDKDSAEIDAFTADLTKRDEVRKVFEKYGKGGIWGVVHIAVRPPRIISKMQPG